uniref:spinster family MFS transporter n=1 Tax=Altererythrobacter segetis TaxID=1104773 RepID=UPI001409C08F|nr:MFS transporter [Altererythrobacter segetis]
MAYRFDAITEGLAMPGETAGTRTRSDWTLATSYSLGFLTLVSAFNYLDRSLLGLALPAIKAEMHVSDTALGFVSGFAFLLFYSLLAIPIGWVADRSNRRNIVAFGFAFWSLMTLLTGWVANIWQLALARFLMGAGESCGLPPSSSMISDLFRKERRPLALSVFGTANSIALIAFYPVLGWIGQRYGWQAMFQAAGAAGLVFAVVFLATVREPARTSRAREAKPEFESLLAGLGQLLRLRSYLALVATAMLMGLNVFAASIWIPTFLQRVHGLSLAEVASTIGPIRGVFGIAGVLLGGFAIDRLIRRNGRWRITIPAIACLLLGPVEVVFLLADPSWLWLAAYAASAFLTLVHQGPVFALVLEVVPARLRALAVATLLLCSALLGQAVGPLLVGMANDALAPALGPQAIRYSLLIIAVTAMLAGVAILLAGRWIEDDLEPAIRP